VQPVALSKIWSRRDTMLRAVLVCGPPRPAYTDHATVYRAEQLAYSLAALLANPRCQSASATDPAA
jgi:hypothetical protein